MISRDFSHYEISARCHQKAQLVKLKLLRFRAFRLLQPLIGLETENFAIITQLAGSQMAVSLGENTNLSCAPGINLGIWIHASEMCMSLSAVAKSNYSELSRILKQT